MMDLIRWNPWRELEHFSRRLDRMFFPDAEGRRFWTPAVDMFEKDGKLVIKAELPGLEKKDVAVDFKDGILTLKGERRFEDEVKEENYYRREMSCGSFMRSFSLPADTDPDKISAEFVNGVLTIEVPKPAASQPKQITVH